MTLQKLIAFPGIRLPAATKSLMVKETAVKTSNERATAERIIVDQFKARKDMISGPRDCQGQGAQKRFRQTSKNEQGRKLSARKQEESAHPCKGNNDSTMSDNLDKSLRE
jgi:hypothetical protein